MYLYVCPCISIRLININLVPSVQVIGNVNTGDQNPIPTFPKGWGGAKLLRTWLSVYIADHLKNGNQELMFILSLIECMYFFQLIFILTLNSMELPRILSYRPKV